MTATPYQFQHVETIKGPAIILNVILKNLRSTWHVKAKILKSPFVIHLLPYPVKISNHTRWASSSKMMLSNLCRCLKRVLKISGRSINTFMGRMINKSRNQICICIRIKLLRMIVASKVLKETCLRRE